MCLFLNTFAFKLELQTWHYFSGCSTLNLNFVLRDKNKPSAGHRSTAAAVSSVRTTFRPVHRAAFSCVATLKRLQSDFEATPRRTLVYVVPVLRWTFALFHCAQYRAICLLMWANSLQISCTSFGHFSNESATDTLIGGPSILPSQFEDKSAIVSQ